MKRKTLARGTAVVAAATLGVALACTGAIAVATELRPADPVRQQLQKLVEQERYPAALATVNGRHHTAGQTPRDGRVRIGSNTKTFVAVAVLQLVGEGKIELDKPIEKYLPGLVRGNGIDGNKITVRHLLQHTAGLPNYTKYLGVQKFEDLRDRYLEPRQLLDLALEHPADFEPGKGFAYSNTGYVLAGLLIQQVTGRPVAEVVTERVINRAGLRQTYWPQVGERDIRGPHPKGYDKADSTKPGSPVVDVTRLDPSWGWAAGQLVAQPSDLNRFFAALLGGELLRPAELAEMKRTVPAPQMGPNISYGLGLIRTELGCGKVMWGHGGSIPGYGTRGGVTEDGREVSLAVTALPGTYGDAETAHRKLERTVEDFACGR